MKRSTLVMCLLLAAGLSGGCREAKPTNCRELFERYYETNIRAFVALIPEADSLTGRRQAECAMEKLFEIDSTFVLMEGRELDDFIRSNREALCICDSLC